jgi:hypothetical protein
MDRSMEFNQFSRLLYPLDAIDDWLDGNVNVR